MKKINIFFSEDSEDMEEEVIFCKQSRSDVVIQINENYYKPIFETMLSVTNAINSSKNQGLNFYFEADLVIIDLIDRESIIKAIHKLYEQDNFYSMKVYTLEEIDQFCRYGFSSYVKVN